MVRTIAQWVKIIGKADATNCSDAVAAAVAIIACCNRKMPKQIEDMANAIQAYAWLLQEHNVKIVKDNDDLIKQRKDWEASCKVED